MINYYSIFKVSNNATLEEIEDAFIRKIMYSEGGKQEDITKGIEILKYESLRKIYDRALIAPEDIGEIIYQSVIKICKNNMAQAANICKSGLEKYPYQKELCLTLCEINNLSHKSNQNLNMLVDLYEKYPNDTDVIFNLGYLYNKINKYNEAYNLLSSIYDSMKYNPAYLAVHSNTCVYLKFFHEGKEMALKVIYDHNQSCYVPFAFTSLLLAQNFIDEKDLRYYYSFFYNYITNDHRYQVATKEALENYIYSLVRLTIFNSPIKATLSHVIGLFKKCGFKSERDKKLTEIVMLCQEIYRMRDEEISSSLIMLSSIYTLTLKSELVYNMNIVSPNVITASKRRVIEDYYVSKEQFELIKVNYPVFSDKIKDLIEDFKNHSYSELIIKYEYFSDEMYKQS